MSRWLSKYIKCSVPIVIILMMFEWKFMAFGWHENMLGQRTGDQQMRNEQKHDEAEIVDTSPYIYVITPTYTRPMQKAMLIRMSQTLLLVKNLHWILVEDSNSTTEMVERLLMESGLIYTHLNAIGNRSHLRGVWQRNAALTWIRNHVRAEEPGEGVVYFADDDNTYHRQLFEEIRSTKIISIFPVGFIGRRWHEGPICKNNTVTGFYSGWPGNRKYQIDMAGFAVNVHLFFKYPDVQFDPRARKGHLESDLLEHLHVTMELLEPRADMCSKVLVWHTKSMAPKIQKNIVHDIEV